MTRLEQHGAVAFALVTAGRRRRLGACLMGMALADTFFLTTVKPSSFIFARTSYTSRKGSSRSLQSSGRGRVRS
jgi:hypothetical protein